MAQNYLAQYPLGEYNAVHHWLKCGVVPSLLQNLEVIIPPDGTPFGAGKRWIMSYWAYNPHSIKLKKMVYRNLPPFTWTPPQERPALGQPAMDDKTWEYAVAQEDMVIDFSRFNFNPSLMQGWLFASLHVDAPLTVQAEIITIGPARLWLNGKLHTHFKKTFSYVASMFIPVTLELQAGWNDVYLHGEMLGWREARLAVGLRFVEKVPVTVGVPIGDINPEKWQAAEQGLGSLQLKQFAFPHLPGRIRLNLEAQAPVTFNVEVTLPTHGSPWARFGKLDVPTGKSRLTLHPGEWGDLPITEGVTRSMAELPGENTLALTLKPADGTPLEVTRSIWASRNTFSSAPYGDYESRRREALEHLSTMPYDVNAAMAAVQMGKTQHISSGAVEVACSFMENRYDCADFYAVSLMMLMHRYGASDVLLPADKTRIENAFLNFKFWIDEPGIDAMCYFTENHQILFHVTAYLAGQYWDEAVFINSGRTGGQQKERAQPRIENWILRRLRGGYSEWDSNAYMALDVFAMLALTEYAESSRLREMAGALLDKTFFMIACQSFKGAHGSTHGRCYVTGLKSARVENTSSLQRIAWGMGIFNGETRATGALAMAQNYKVPEVIQHIGADVNRVLVTKARSKEKFRPQFDLQTGEWDVSTLTYRTPDVMLSAALDHRPGAMGVQEHLWQATLSPEAVVFTTYPGNSQEHGEARPNFWSGSGRLPRVGMVDKTVICLYRFEPRVGLGFSHAYFPTLMFDEHRIEDQWAFGRYDDGYVALWGDGDLRLTESGRHAGQELRSSGAGQAWICHVGRKADDGSFDAFCSKVMQNAPQSSGINARWTTPEGSRLAFAWEGAFTVDEIPQDWSDYPHYENAYTDTRLGAEDMLIHLGGDVISLNLKHGKRL